MFPASDSNNGDSHPMFLPQLEHDPRWVRCKRPYIISGGELTLEMLDLDFDPHSKYYEAPLQMIDARRRPGGLVTRDRDACSEQLVSPRRGVAE